MNIKDPEAHRLAKEIAAHTGETLTETVLSALRDKRARVLPGRARKIDMKAVRAIIKRSSKLMREGRRFDFDDLYDEKTGLPK